MKEAGAIETVCLGIEVLFGDENEHWEYYETDPDWWELRLYTRRN